MIGLTRRTGSRVGKIILRGRLKGFSIRTNKEMGKFWEVPEE